MENLRERYIAMRRSGQYDLNWFYEYYLLEFPNIPKTWFKNGVERERELIPQGQFIQSFSLPFSMIAASILDHLDGVFNVTKLEGTDGKLIHIA